MPRTYSRWTEPEEAILKDSKTAPEAHRRLIRAGFSRSRGSVTNHLQYLRELGEATPSAMQLLRNRIAELEARIDQLMLEYCPDEMTPEQLERWGAHQRSVGAELNAD